MTTWEHQGAVVFVDLFHIFLANFIIFSLSVQPKDVSGYRLLSGCLFRKMQKRGFEMMIGPGNKMDDRDFHRGVVVFSSSFFIIFLRNASFLLSNLIELLQIH